MAYPLLHATVTEAPKSSAGGVQQEQEMGKRRTIALASITCGALACIPLAWAAPAAADDKPPLKVGVLEDHSGDIAIFTMPKVHGAHLAVDEINAAGGILGRKVEIVEYDPQFDNAKFQEFARRLIEKIQRNLVMGRAEESDAAASRVVGGSQHVVVRKLAIDV